MRDKKFNLADVLNGCKKNKRRSQKVLYEHFFGYGMSISLRYSSSKEDALEVLNDSFLKIFLNLNKYDDSYPFKPWLRKIIIHTATDHYRANKRHQAIIVPLNEINDPIDEPDFSEKLFAERDLMPIIQRLPPAYRLVFNLYVMEGYKHHEIATLLGIHEGTSKSNLARAKAKLKAWILKDRARKTKSNSIPDA